MKNKIVMAFQFPFILLLAVDNCSLTGTAALLT